MDGSHFYFPLFVEFQNKHPEYTLNITFGNETDLISGLIHKKLHCMVMPHMLSSKIDAYPEIKKTDIFQAADYLVLPPGTIEYYGSIPEAISKLPFITKSNEASYHDFIREKLQAKYNVTYPGVKIAYSQDVQTMMIALSQGFAVIPLSELMSIKDFQCFPLGEEFIEILQLFYNSKHMNEPLRELKRFIESQDSMANY